MTRTVKTRQTAEEKAAAAKEREERNARLAAEQIANSQTAEQLAIADEDEQYRKALNERGDLTLIPEKKVRGNNTVKQVSDKVYPGGMVICERL